MSSRRIGRSLFLAAGIAIVALLVMPAVHVPFIVVHGPVSALRAQRMAWLLNFLIRAAAFLFAGLLMPLLHARANREFFVPRLNSLAPICLSSPMRC